ncbi:MAG: hypothetical protein FJ009_14910 [Chloroflexi bacterium]|nr:hypothetical protein [Chloroflexota bacterium]
MSLSIEHTDARDFFAYLRLKNLSARTIIEYQWVLKDFFRFCPTDLTATQDVTFAHLRDYVAGLQERKLAAKTVSDRVIILKRFFGYLLTEGRLISDPAQRLPMPKVGKRLPKALTLAEMQAFFSVMSRSSRSARRDRVLFELMYAGGLRVSEAVGLRVEDIDFADGSVRIIGKGDKERRVYLKPALMQLLQEHIAVEHLASLLFPGRNGKTLTPRLVELRIKRYAKAASITRLVTPHTLRHSIAVHCLQGGAPVNFVQGLLGHASLATTGKYLQLTDQMAKEIALKTRTALDRGEGAREIRAGYRLRPKTAWDVFVAVVMEWLAAN